MSCQTHGPLGQWSARPKVGVISGPLDHRSAMLDQRSARSTFSKTKGPQDPWSAGASGNVQSANLFLIVPTQLGASKNLAGLAIFLSSATMGQHVWLHLPSGLMPDGSRQERRIQEGTITILQETKIIRIMMVVCNVGLEDHCSRGLLL